MNQLVGIPCDPKDFANSCRNIFKLHRYNLECHVYPGTTIEE